MKNKWTNAHSVMGILDTKFDSNLQEKLARSQNYVI